MNPMVALTNSNITKTNHLSTNAKERLYPYTFNHFLITVYRLGNMFNKVQKNQKIKEVCTIPYPIVN